MDDGIYFGQMNVAIYAVKRKRERNICCLDQFDFFFGCMTEKPKKKLQRKEHVLDGSHGPLHVDQTKPHSIKNKNKNLLCSNGIRCAHIREKQ